MAQVTFNRANFQRKLESAVEDVNEEAQGYLLEIAGAVVRFSPVDTGAYVLSHSAKANNTGSRGRSRSSKGKPRHQDPNTKKSQALGNLISDINAMFADAENLQTVTFRNDSPHAQYVEHKHGYKVFTKIRNLYR